MKKIVDAQARPDHPAQPATDAMTLPTRNAPWRSSNRWLWVLQVVLAIGFVMAAAAKFSDDPQTIAQLSDLGIDVAGMHVIGGLEFAGALGLLVPRLCGLAATAFVALMLGAVVATIVTFGVVAAIAPATFLIVAAAVAWGRRDRTTRLVAFVAGRVQ